MTYIGLLRIIRFDVILRCGLEGEMFLLGFFITCFIEVTCLLLVDFLQEHAMLKIFKGK